MAGLRIWLEAVRPRTLPAAATPVLVGAAIAEANGGLQPVPTLLVLCCALLLQIGANLANDVFDHEKGADTAERVGPRRAVQAGLISARSMKIATAVVLGLALALGVVLVQWGGWPILAIGLCSIAAALAYTGGPYPLAYNGLGDVFVVVFFGFAAVCGTVWLNLGSVPPLAWLASVPVGFLATAILVVNNVRDRHSDARAGKRTLVVRFGRRGARIELWALLLGSYLVPVGLAVVERTWWFLLPLVTLPAALLLSRAVERLEGSALNPVLGGTAKLLLQFGVLFAIGIVLASKR